MSNPKYRNTIPEAESKPKEKLKVNDPVIQSAINLGEEMERHKQKKTIDSKINISEEDVAELMQFGEHINDIIDSVPDKKTKKWWHFWRRK